MLLGDPHPRHLHDSGERDVYPATDFLTLVGRYDWG